MLYISIACTVIWCIRSLPVHAVTSENYEAINSINIYSPVPVMVRSTLVIYFSGCYAPFNLHDHVYRAECHNYPTQKCDAVAMLINLLLYSLDHLNDPSVVYCTQTKE
jgi:hypothetical protein